MPSIWPFIELDRVVLGLGRSLFTLSVVIAVIVDMTNTVSARGSMMNLLVT